MLHIIYLLLYPDGVLVAGTTTNQFFLLRTNLSFSQNVCIDSLISYTDTTPWCVQSVSHDTPGILLTLLEEEFDIQQFSVIFEATDAHAVGGWVGLVHKIPQPNSSCVCVCSRSLFRRALCQVIPQQTPHPPAVEPDVRSLSSPRVSPCGGGTSNKL